MIIAIISSLLFYLLPIFLGRPIVKLLYKKELSYPFISYFAVGAITLYAGLLVTFALKAFIPSVSGLNILQETILGLSFLLLPLNLIVSREDIDVEPFIFPAILSLLLGVVSYLIWQFKSPFSFNWDMFEHQTLVNTVLKGNVSVIPSSLTDTFGFNGYSTLFHSLIAVSQTFFSINVMQYWTAISGVHLVLAIFASYLLTREITDNKFTAAIAATITALVFDSSISFTTMFFIPQTFTAVLFTFLFTQLLSEAKSGRLPRLTLMVFQTLFLFINHYIVGLAAATFYLGSYLYIRFSLPLEKRLGARHIIMGLLFLALLGILFSPALPLGFINSGEAQDYSLTVIDKFNIMKQTYGYLMLLLLPLGVWAAVANRKRIELFSLVITVLLLSVVIAQIPYTVKFFTLARFFTDAFIAIGVYYLIKPMNLFFRGLSLAVLALVLCGILIINAASWKGILRYQNTFSQVSPYELQAANFLKNAYGSTNAMIISDPATQNILEPIAHVNSQGGAYMTTYSRETLAAAGRTDNTSEVAADVYKIQDKIEKPNKRLLVLTGRYFTWQDANIGLKKAFSYNVWNPSALTLEDIEKVDHLISDSAHFQLVYQNPEVAILEVKK